MTPAPMKTAGAALSAAFRVEERCARLVEALMAARAVIATIQHEADPETVEVMAKIEAALRREPKIPYRGWWISFDPPPIPARNCDWSFHHDDFDGAEDSGDNRCGHAGSLAAAIVEIDEREDEASASRAA